MSKQKQTLDKHSELAAVQHPTDKVSSCVVLLSGGQDSTTCLWMAKLRFERVIAVSFNYGQRHSAELRQAAEIAQIAKCSEHKIFDIRGLLSGSAQTEHSLDVNAAHATNPSLPATFTAGRNALFLTLAASYAHGLGIRDIYTGVCETDYSGYPDCRQDFIDAQQSALRLALDSPHLCIHTPLMKLNKAQIWKAAVDLGCFDIVRNLTLTDYNGNETMNAWGMGAINNPASELRAKGFVDAWKKGWVSDHKVVSWLEPEFAGEWTPQDVITHIEFQLSMWGYIIEARAVGIDSRYDAYGFMAYMEAREAGKSIQDAVNAARESYPTRTDDIPDGIIIRKIESNFQGPEIDGLLRGIFGE